MFDKIKEIVNWFMGIIEIFTNPKEFFEGLWEGILTKLAEWILGGYEYIFANAFDVERFEKALKLFLEMEFVKGAIFYMQVLTIALIIVKLMVDITNDYFLFIGEGTQQDAQTKVIIYVVTTVIIVSFPFVIKELIEFGVRFSNDIMAVVEIDVGGLTLEQKTAIVTEVNFMKLFGFGVVFLTLQITKIMLIFQAFVRGAQLVFSTVFGILLSVDIVSGDMKAFMSNVMEIVGIVITTGFQLLMLKGFYYVMLDLGGEMDALTHTIAIVAWATAVIHSPKFIQNKLQQANNSGFALNLGKQAVKIGSNMRKGA